MNNSDRLGIVPRSIAGMFRFLNRFPLLELAFLLFAAWYARIWWNALSPWWFHHAWTTDDATQQVYPFHKVLHPNAFSGDYITEMMERYLAPLHYWISYAITWLTGNPMMMTHWVMLIQVVLGVGFLILAVRHLAAKGGWGGWVPALFAGAWLLHSRLPMQRITGGLPRGWSLAVLTAGLYCLAAGHHRTILFVILCGCLLNPPATLIIALTYGAVLLWRVGGSSTRAEYWPHLRRYLIVAPIFAVITLSVTQMPEHLGKMASLEQAEQLPEFQRPHGRFPFVPLLDWAPEVRTVFFQAFISRLHNPGRLLKQWTPEIVLGLLLLIVVTGLLRQRVRANYSSRQSFKEGSEEGSKVGSKEGSTLIPVEIWFFGMAALLVYFASREFAFKLYVPNRHLQIPGVVFLVTLFSVGIWRVVTAQSDRLGSKLIASLLLVALGGFVYRTSGDGLQGSMNFNYSLSQRADRRGNDVFKWIRNETPLDYVVAGFPTFIDPVQLFSIRAGYVTTETAHPFFENYRIEMRRRLEITLRAHYAASWEEFLQTMGEEKIDLFVFDVRRFGPDSTYFPPHDQLVRQLLASDSLVFHQLPEELDLNSLPFFVYRDGRAKVVDVNLLRKFLAGRGSGESSANGEGQSLDGETT